MPDGYGDALEAARQERKDRLLTCASIILSGLVCVHPSASAKDQARKAIEYANALIIEIEKL